MVAAGEGGGGEGGGAVVVRALRGKEKANRERLALLDGGPGGIEPPRMSDRSDASYPESYPVRKLAGQRVGGSSGLPPHPGSMDLGPPVVDFQAAHLELAQHLAADIASEAIGGEQLHAHGVNAVAPGIAHVGALRIA